MVSLSSVKENNILSLPIIWAEKKSCSNFSTAIA